jgi:hypothetical protein
MSSMLTSDSRTSLWTTMLRTSPLSSQMMWVGRCGTKILKLQLINKFRSFKLEGFEIWLFQAGCFTFRSAARKDLVLKFKSSVMSASLHSKQRFIKRYKQHFSMSNQLADLHCFYWKEGTKVNICRLTATAVLPLWPSWQLVQYMVIWNVQPHVQFQTSPSSSICFQSSKACLPILLASNATIFRGLWTVTTIMFQQTKYRFSNN